ncbi:MAG: 4Fe-4S dicluster domain-containing protein [Ignavibacteria bacterium]|nr:4Fe-4S dicluster domain-containing protein [Ignavibacteria bacterium]
MSKKPSEQNSVNSHWKSIGEYQDSSSIVEIKQNEFINGATDEFDVSELPILSRRKFLALLSASAAVTVTACTDYRDKGEIVPYTNKPEEITIGKANYYASTCNLCKQNCGILVKTREGRPIKIDGNPDHPVNKGKICNKGQANILNLYDPERLRHPIEKATNSSFIEKNWEEVDKKIIEKLKQSVSANKEIALVAHTNYSPSAKKLFDGFVKVFPNAKIYTYELFSEANKLLAWQKCYGNLNLPVIRLNEAKIILSLDSDFLATDGSVIENIRQFTQQRDIDSPNDFNRLYVIEGRMSLTGMNADYRLRLRPDFQFEFAMSLLSELVLNRGLRTNGIDSSVLSELKKYSLIDFVKKHSFDPNSINNLVGDLIANQGKSIILGGNSLSEQTHIVLNILNDVLGSSKLYDEKSSQMSFQLETSSNDINGLVQKMGKGEVGAVIFYDTNPTYHFPSLDFANQLKKVGISIGLTESKNETSELCHYVLPINNLLESWGDYQTRSGIISLQQPVISPIYKTRQKESILLTWLTGSFDEKNYHEFIRQRWEKEFYPSLKLLSDFTSFWYASLHDGIVTVTENKPQTNKLSISSDSLFTREVKQNNFYVHLVEGQNSSDGRFANNGWLQEIPHPVSKIVWDNYAAVSPKTAKEFKLEDNDVIEIESDDKKISVPCFIQAGQSDGLISIELGYGRTVCGEVGKNVGVNANALINFSDNSPIFYLPASISKTSRKYNLVTAQEHHALDDEFVKDIHRKRKIIQEGTVQQYLNDPKFIQKEKHDVFSITNEVEYNGLKWGMAIDLNKCIGCSGCVSACISENNIPVVGKEQVEKGREMHWMRIDRYYSGTLDEPIVSNQPMLCQHCDHAPCENVCPVAATNHSPDGLNQMAYNRCVGTRYCSNNCPYKVRRFNFLDFRETFEEGYYSQQPISLLNNPEVTVRSRGVMEKCTFCIQRIMEARQIAVEEGRELKGIDVMTACQVACPSLAIEFGDVNDPNSIVSMLRKHELGYHVLEEINVRPNVTYIAKLRNTHSEEV